MNESLRKNEGQKKFFLGMVFMAFLMGIATYYEIWVLPMLIKMLTKIIS